MRKDIAFRPALCTLRRLWEQEVGGAARPSDGFFLVNDLRVPRKRAWYSGVLLAAYDAAVTEAARAVANPIQYAGPGQWSIFPQPVRFEQVADAYVGVPGTQSEDVCVLVGLDLWQTFASLS